MSWATNVRQWSIVVEWMKCHYMLRPQVAELHNGEITRYQLTPSDFGLRPYCDK